MRTLDQIVITDPTFDKNADYSRFDRFLLSLIRDERDLPFVHLIIKITLFVMIPGVALFFLSGWIWWAVAVLFFVVSNFVYKGPFGLMLHCTSHRRLFKREYNILNEYIPWVLSPFFGQVPETYFAHHIGMHHIENNLEDDDSSTIYYQRDSFRDFMKYFGVFLASGAIKILFYHRNRGSKALARKVLIGEVFYYALLIVLLVIDFRSAFVVLLLPHFIFRFITMLGNWTQHAFVDPDDPGNNFKNSITCINVKYNHKCWNDGYHASHHEKPNKHWTDHPHHLHEARDIYAKHKAVIFDGLDFLAVFWHLMHKNYSKLADHMVNIDNTFADKEEAIAHLKRRTAKFSRPALATA